MAEPGSPYENRARNRPNKTCVTFRAQKTFRASTKQQKRNRKKLSSQFTNTVTNRQSIVHKVNYPEEITWDNDWIQPQNSYTVMLNAHQTQANMREKYIEPNSHTRTLQKRGPKGRFDLTSNFGLSAKDAAPMRLKAARAKVELQGQWIPYLDGDEVNMRTEDPEMHLGPPFCTTWRCPRNFDLKFEQYAKLSHTNRPYYETDPTGLDMLAPRMNHKEMRAKGKPAWENSFYSHKPKKESLYNMEDRAKRAEDKLPLSIRGFFGSDYNAQAQDSARHGRALTSRSVFGGSTRRAMESLELQERVTSHSRPVSRGQRAQTARPSTSQPSSRLSRGSTRRSIPVGQKRPPSRGWTGARPQSRGPPTTIAPSARSRCPKLSIAVAPAPHNENLPRSARSPPGVWKRKMTVEVPKSSSHRGGGWSPKRPKLNKDWGNTSLDDRGRQPQTARSPNRRKQQGHIAKPHTSRTRSFPRPPQPGRRVQTPGKRFRVERESVEQVSTPNQRIKSPRKRLPHTGRKGHVSITEPH